MDFTPSGWAAVYEPSTSDDQVSWRPVERFNGEGEHAAGEALVVDERQGRLVPANSLKGFQRLVPANLVVAAVAAAPGWRLKIWADHADDASVVQLPIVAWIVDATGTAHPVPRHLDGQIRPLEAQHREVIPPD